MKKLFVLFLLVALVPFTIGCGLFGDNDDTTAVPPSTILKASVSGVKLPLSMRASALEDVNAKKVTLTINGIVLYPYEAVESAGLYSIKFSAVADASSTNYKDIIAGGKVIIVTLTTVDTAGKITESSVSIPSAPAFAADSTLSVTTTAAGMIEPLSMTVVTPGKTPVDIVAVTIPQGERVAPAALTYKATYTHGTTTEELGTNLASATMVYGTLLPSFKLTLNDSKKLNVEKADFQINVKNENGAAAVALTTKDFSFLPTTGEANEVTFTVSRNAPKTLKGGQTYKIEIVTVSDGANTLAAKTFYFKLN